MSISMRNILIIGLCVSLGACAFKKEDAEDKQRQDLADDVAKKIQEDQKNSVVELKESTVPVTFEEKDLGYYEFKIQWPESVGSVEVYLNNNFETTVTGKNYFTKVVLHNEVVSYRIRAYASVQRGGAFIQEYFNTSQAPFDFLIYQNFNMKEDVVAEAKRAYIHSGSKIVTNGHNLTIKAEKLIVAEFKGPQSGNPAQYSQIVTHETSEPSKTNFSSKINIQAKVAIGTLQIAMIGKDGQNGKNGEEFATERGISLLPARAMDGINGKDGTMTRNICSLKKNPDTCVPDSCTSSPTSGSNGADGADGFPGQDGQNGGDAGFVKIEVTDDSEFFLEIYQKPGKGGLGGKGSPGQAGGKGGAAGKKPPACSKSASAGTDGKSGNPGPDGKDGVEGRAIVLDTKVRNQRIR
ncbi:hypothetical protein DOM22_09425 [Bdellovibrio sp. ZAP7]|uniref:hypothetical protein n=1 Tax=Bdellovibrio sp. ZAP7 TaxID=2231053 RepID=UPI00115B3295|nr:hypothetical protein [Bdellovibrio sp. ZAP7]QDK45357.1 hypothetical protein DOM22_09425 [Bdellovibrio sp. ZAP7]